MPLMLNPLFIIPFILAPVLAVVIAYFAIVVLQIVPAPLGIMNLSYVPALFRGFINCGFQGVILELVIVIISMVIYYPFFRIADKQALANENKEA